MGFLDKLLGTDDGAAQARHAPAPARGATPPGDAGAQAIERYRYLLRTAPPDAIEQAHEEAFARLSPEQRQQVLQEMSQQVDPSERPASDDPRALARAATRAEVRQPGFMERTFGGSAGGAMGMGSGLGGTLLAGIAGSFIGSSIAHSLFGGMHDLDGAGPVSAGLMDDPHEVEASQVDDGDLGSDLGGDVGGDFGGDFGDIDL